MDWINSVAAGGITAVGLVVLLYFAQMRGHLYFKPQWDEKVLDHKSRLAELRIAKELRVAEVEVDRERRVMEIQEDRGVRIAELAEERDHLREALVVTRETLRMQTEQMADVLDATKTGHVALQSIARAGGDLPAEGD